MTSLDIITQLFCHVDDKLAERNLNHKHGQAKLYPSEVVTLALLFALKGVGNRAFYRWIKRDYKPLFPLLPFRTRLLGLFKRHTHLIDVFMADKSLIGVIDTYGIELIHPRRFGRSENQRSSKNSAQKRKIKSTMDCWR